MLSLEIIFAAVVAAVIPAVIPGGAGDPTFEDATGRSGIRFRNACGSPEKEFIFEVNGNGVALVDVDGDADLDVFFVNGARLESPTGTPPPRSELYRNDGALRFVDVTGASGLADSGWGCGCAAADVDNDSDLDLYVTRWGPNALYLNRGDGTFERARESGAEDPGMSTSSSFGDFDGDGLVDLYVANYVELDPKTAKKRSDGTCLYKEVPVFCGPGGLRAAPDSLYINLGGGRFRDASEAWGVREVPPAYALGTLAADVNRDGRMDVVVANDTMRNYCFLNDGGRRFQEAGVFLGLAYNDYGVAQAGMGVAAGDLRGLGRCDIFITNFEDDTNTLHLAETGGLYSDATYAAGLGADSYRYLGWGTFFFDAENDGDLDIFVANGHVAPQADQMRNSIGYRQKNHLYIRDGNAPGGEPRFRLCSEGCGGGLDVKKSSRGAAFGDLDGDGDPDIVVSNIDDVPTILENTTKTANSWVAFRLRGVRSNRSAIGARAIIEAGGKRQERTVQSGVSFASQSELTLRFGLGQQDTIDHLRVEWPSGLREEFPPPAARTVTQLVEGSGRTIAPAEQAR